MAKADKREFPGSYVDGAWVPDRLKNGTNESASPAPGAPSEDDDSNDNGSPTTAPSMPPPAPKPSIWDQSSTPKDRRRGKDFPLRDVLQQITGLMLSRDWDEQLEFVAYMIGKRRRDVDKAITYPAALPLIRAEIIRQYPKLASYQEIRFDADDSAIESAEWLEELEREFGALLRIDTLADDEIDHLDADIEKTLKQMNPPKKRTRVQHSDSLEGLRV